MRLVTDQRSDAELITAVVAGEIDAFGALVARHQRGAVRIAAIALGSTDGADDVAQDSFVKAYRAIGGFRVGAAFEPWLYRIVTNTAKNKRRGDRRRQALHLRGAATVDIDGPGPDELAAQRVDRQQVVDAINRLKVEDRLVLTYRWYEQLTEAEIADALDCRPGTVKSRLSRAMGRLRRELGES